MHPCFAEFARAALRWGAVRCGAVRCGAVRSDVCASLPPSEPRLQRCCCCCGFSSVNKRAESACCDSTVLIKEQRGGQTRHHLPDAATESQHLQVINWAACQHKHPRPHPTPSVPSSPYVLRRQSVRHTRRFFISVRWATNLSSSWPQFDSSVRCSPPMSVA